jgi:hypothetical protein
MKGPGGKGQGKPGRGKGKGKDRGSGAGAGSTYGNPGSTYGNPGRPKSFQPTQQDRPIYTNFFSSNLCRNQKLLPPVKGESTYLVDFALPTPPSSPLPPLPPLRMSPWCNCSTSFLICNPRCVFPPLPAVPFLGCPCVPCVCAHTHSSRVGLRISYFIARTIHNSPDEFSVSSFSFSPRSYEEADEEGSCG